MIKEACVEGFNQAFRAEQLGADRIELCENLAVGGTTPSIGTVLQCKKVLKIPVIVMIRPRGGNFVYSEQETEVMSHDIEACRNAGADGIAIGLLDENRNVDMALLLKLLKKAGRMQVTFHKAIDVTIDIEREFMRLRDSGLIKRVLTSGGAPEAMSGASVLNKLIRLSQGKIQIIVAGKVTDHNLPQLTKLINANEFHGKMIVGNVGLI